MQTVLGFQIFLLSVLCPEASGFNIIHLFEKSSYNALYNHCQFLAVKGLIYQCASKMRLGILKITSMAIATLHISLCVCVRACARACVRARVRAVCSYVDVSNINLVCVHPY